MGSLAARIRELEARVPAFPPDIEIDFLGGTDVSGPDWAEITSQFGAGLFPLKIYRNTKTGRRAGVWASDDEYPPGADLRFL
jgi:hypothetical protein